MLTIAITCLGLGYGFVRLVHGFLISIRTVISLGSKFRMICGTVSVAVGIFVSRIWGDVRGRMKLRFIIGLACSGVYVWVSLAGLSSLCVRVTVFIC